ncbi:uncharacterized protein A1O9_01224 [Exophiala aquamarina CBS 119918]|uniref:Spc7 kinetochore protein domain-containing protein n=1 Tax=Exophiala aquamarina CBS 119918 TaxID=1182545 RepID=A0A072PU39_9EURO|nr:uncharacterized protein A1O9_01224 [Exophiala aquamarina CBS 119918]KEF63247.1 hypothetical protein A1O9_01224 [Exophiala aquamarina CBS 119918]
MDDLTTECRPAKPRIRQSIAHIPSSKSPAFKDNATTDIAALQAEHGKNLAAKKKSRGKSIGPGGLEALTETSANSVKISTPFQIKSILKPAIPLTPPKVIPTFDELRKRSTGKAKSPNKQNAEELLIDFSTPGPNTQNGADLSISGTEDVSDPFSPIARKSPAKDGASSSDLEREKDAERKHQEEKKAILERRAARRKSLANRRVSFAPEATLHTWSVMEVAEDSTTSSASNSTRRQSSITVSQSPTKPEASSGTPQTASAQDGLVEDPLVKESPAHQKARRRRSSGLPGPMLDASQDDVFSSSPSGDITTNSSPIRVEEGIESSDESDTDGDTAMSMDETTSHTVTSQESGSSTHSSLEERLRQAASQAGTRGIDYDENGEELSMELVTGTVTHAFQPRARNREIGFENSALHDQETGEPLSSSRQSPPLQPVEDEDVEEQDLDQTEEMSMEVTKAVGGIVSKQSPQTKSRKSPAPRRRSSIRRRRSSGAESALDNTMEFTVMQGGIIDHETEEVTSNLTMAQAADDGMTMEFTSAVGGILGSSNRRTSTASDQMEENDSMDMTAAVGGILPPIEEQTEPQTDVDEDQTSAMELTRAVGSIIQQSSRRHSTTRGSSGVRPDIGTDAPSPYHAQPVADQSTTPKSTPKPLQVASVASETGSPSLALKPRLSSRAQKKSASMISTTPPSKAKSLSSVKSVRGTPGGTPLKQMTPLPYRAETPNKTPLRTNMIEKSASPKKLFKAELQARASPRSIKRESAVKAASLFSRDAETGQQTPSVILRATRQGLARRKSSGIGIDKEGVGSPRISELLDRRSSIGDAVPQFKLGVTDAPGTRSEDPQQLAQEVEADRVEEYRRESGRFIMEQEADERVGDNSTLQLKDMIEAMSPKKPKAGKMRGRKSLAVGGAKGLLGKRPAELDLDEEDEDEAEPTPKRLKAVSREVSPVKQVHLPKPPSKDETTGRLSAKLQNSLPGFASNSKATPKIGSSSPVETAAPSSPSTTGRYRDIRIDADARPTSFEDKLDNVVGAIDMSTAQMLEQANIPDEPKISLQEFLNMTNIHFIELSTTKRRHTMAQTLPNRKSQESVHDNTLEETFVAAATTLPLLELYQHSTRELKSYISTGRKIVRSIEAETLAEQPPLFREYIDARPDVKLVMDNQFRNGKANARLQSKEGWYRWRSQLVDGLKTGLQSINGNLSHDLEILDNQQHMLDSVIPGLLQQQTALQKLQPSLQQSIEELDSIDHETLKKYRQELQAADEYFLQRTALLSSLQEQMAEKEETLAAAAELQVEIRDQIEEADRVREEHKGWSSADVLALKMKVEQIQNETGWRLISAEEEADEPNEFGTALTMMYKNELRLFMYPQVYQATHPTRRRSGRRSASTSGPSAPISLTFAPAIDNDAEFPVPELSTERRFFLQLIRSQLHAFSMMPNGSIPPKSLLSTVSQGWNLAARISQELRLLNMVGITTASILGDEKLGVKVMLILPKQGRVDIEFAVSVTILTDGNIGANTIVTATALYGDATDCLTGSKSRKVQQALSKEIESRHLGNGAWVNAVHGFEAWLAAQQRPKQEAKQQEEAAPVPAAQAPPPPAATSTVTVPVPSSKRSPLAPKKANVLQKKALPVPKQRLEKNNFHLSTSSLPGTTVHEKENFNPSLSMSKAVFDTSHQEPAIPPEMQEVMMHTPIKRVGALRRSPI